MTIWTPRSVRVSRVVWIGETLETFFWDLLAILYLTQRLFEEDKLVKMLKWVRVKPDLSQTFQYSSVTFEGSFLIGLNSTGK